MRINFNTYKPYTLQNNNNSSNVMNVNRQTSFTSIPDDIYDKDAPSGFNITDLWRKKEEINEEIYYPYGKDGNRKSGEKEITNYKRIHEEFDDDEIVFGDIED